MIITDLISDDKHFDKFLKLIEECYHSDYKLKENYVNILERYDEYEAFILLIDEEEPVAFCGLQKFGNSLRTYTRYYLAKKYRFHNKMQNKKMFFESSQYILPWSIDFARKNNYSYLFASFQSDLPRQRMIDIFHNHANKYTGEYWERLDRLYNTCKNNLNQPQCWQHIIRCTLIEGDKWNLISQQN